MKVKQRYVYIAFEENTKEKKKKKQGFLIFLARFTWIWLFDTIPC